ncbi:MAG TPA: hypothetical protein PKI11_01955, partial [Candidatus Hydrogenedentes bacterium]|nr:hypothetical protein [Candidatus Hydrogenedentota bacterium]
KVTDRYLCEACMARYQGDEGTGFELATPPKMLDQTAGDRVVRDTSTGRQGRCPTCGAPLSQVSEEGKVGCTSCYTHFGRQIDSILEGLHPSLHHRGKAPRLDDTRARLRADLQTKRSLLRTMLGAEKYEEAAQLRDEIRDLETGLYVSESGAD